MSDRDSILRRIHMALGDRVEGEDLKIVRTYRRTTPSSADQRVAEFEQRVADYHATVRRVAGSELGSAIASSCRRRGVKSLVVPDDLPEDWLPDNITILRDGAGRHCSNEELDRTDGALTGCALAIAQTGSIVLDGGTRQGRRAISLLPDYHLCVVRADQIVGLVPEAVSFLHSEGERGRGPVTLVSGPSATSDIELTRIEGVHGPRNLEVLVVD